MKVLTVEDQIGLKVQSSSNDPERLHQDMADIELLIKNNYRNLDLNLLREYFSLFERKEEFEKYSEMLMNLMNISDPILSKIEA